MKKLYDCNRNRVWTTLLFLMVGLLKIDAQTIPVAIIEPTQVAACDSNRFQVSLTASATFSIKILPRIVTGNQSTLSLSCQDTIPVFPIKLFSDTTGNPNISEAVFQPSDSSWVIDVLDTGLISFDYFVLVDCAIIQDSTLNNSLNLVQTFTCQSCVFTFEIDSSGTSVHTISNIKSPRLTNVSAINFEASYKNASSLLFEYVCRQTKVHHS